MKMIKLKCPMCGFPISRKREYIHDVFKEKDKYIMQVKCCNCDFFPHFDLDLYLQYISWLRERSWKYREKHFFTKEKKNERII